MSCSSRLAALLSARALLDAVPEEAVQRFPVGVGQPDGVLEQKVAGRPGTGRQVAGDLPDDLNGHPGCRTRGCGPRGEPAPVESRSPNGRLADLVMVEDLDGAEGAVLDLGATRHEHQPGTSVGASLTSLGTPSAPA